MDASLCRNSETIKLMHHMPGNTCNHRTNTDTLQHSHLQKRGSTTRNLCFLYYICLSISLTPSCLSHDDMINCAFSLTMQLKYYGKHIFQEVCALIISNCFRMQALIISLSSSIAYIKCECKRF